MIWESSDWKEPLLKTATWLRRLRLGPGTRHQTFARIEREVFISFYSVRKLMDTYKISDNTKRLKCELKWYPNRAPVNFLNWHKIDQLFDLTAERTEMRTLKFICNIFVHSYIFLPSEEESGRISGFFVTSDRDKNKKVYWLSLDSLCKICRAVGRDYPQNLQRKVDPKTGQFDVKVW